MARCAKGALIFSPVCTFSLWLIAAMAWGGARTEARVCSRACAKRSARARRSRPVDTPEETSVACAYGELGSDLPLRCATPEHGSVPRSVRSREPRGTTQNLNFFVWRGRRRPVRKCEIRLTWALWTHPKFFLGCEQAGQQAAKTGWRSSAQIT